MPSNEREANWRVALVPYYRESGIDASAIPPGPGQNASGCRALSAAGVTRSLASGLL